MCACVCGAFDLGLLRHMASLQLSGFIIPRLKAMGFEISAACEASSPHPASSGGGANRLIMTFCAIEN